MKRSFLVATALMTLSGSMLLAQQAAAVPQAAPVPHHHHHNPHREAARLGRKLNLTPDQTAKVEPILAERNQKMKDLRTNTSLSQQDMRQQRKALRRSTHEQLASVLTPDQLQQMRAMRHEHGKHGEGQQPAPPQG